MRKIELLLIHLDDWHFVLILSVSYLFSLLAFSIFVLFPSSPYLREKVRKERLGGGEKGGLFIAMTSDGRLVFFSPSPVLLL